MLPVNDCNSVVYLYLSSLSVTPDRGFGLDRVRTVYLQPIESCGERGATLEGELLVPDGSWRFASVCVLGKTPI